MDSEGRRRQQINLRVKDTCSWARTKFSTYNLMKSPFYTTLLKSLFICPFMICWIEKRFFFLINPYIQLLEVSGSSSLHGYPFCAIPALCPFSHPNHNFNSLNRQILNLTQPHSTSFSFCFRLRFISRVHFSYLDSRPRCWKMGAFPKKESRFASRLRRLRLQRSHFLFIIFITFW